MSNKPKCLNQFNEYYFTEFQQLAKDAKEKNSQNLFLIYKKVSLSISKYPLPILSASQASLLEGIGDTISKTFERLVNSYKEKIEKEGLNYLEMAYNTNSLTNNDKKKGCKRKAQSDTEQSALENKSELKKRKKLVNIDIYSSVWSSVVCSYILFLQSNSLLIDIEDVLAMSRTLTDELKAVKQIEASEGIKDFKQMKVLNLVESIEVKEKKIKITEFLVKLAKIELKKSGIIVDNDGQGGLNFTITEPEINNNFENSKSVTAVSGLSAVTGLQTSNLFNNNNLNTTVNKFNNKTSNIVSSFPQINQITNNININSFNNNLNRSSLSSKQSNSSKSRQSEEKAKNSTLDSFVKSTKKFKEEDCLDFSFLGNSTSNVNYNNNSSNNPFILNSSTSIHTNNNISNNIIKTSIHSNREFSFSNANNQYNPNKSNNNSSNNTNKLLLFKKTKSKIPKENIFLVVDNREKGPKGEKFPEEIRKLRPDIQIRECNLAIGDFMWTYIDPVTGFEFILDFIIERKTIEDLAKSILDGRYHEQKYRLKNCGIKNIYYMFEGNNFILPRGNISKQAIITAIFHTVNIHDLNIIKSSSIEDSVNYFIRMNDLIVKNAEFYTNITNVESVGIHSDSKILFSQFTQINGKTKNSTIENIFVRQLRCFDDCGAKSVDILRKVFKCPRFIYDLLQKVDDDEETRENLFNVASYLIENSMDISEENLLFYSKLENYKKIKKGVKSVKKIRKTTNVSIVKFYS